MVSNTNTYKQSFSKRFCLTVRLKIKKLLKSEKLNFVRAGRLELPHLAALDPKSSVYCTKETQILSFLMI